MTNLIIANQIQDKQEAKLFLKLLDLVLISSHFKHLMTRRREKTTAL